MWDGVAGEREGSTPSTGPREGLDLRSLRS